MEKSTLMRVEDSIKNLYEMRAILIKCNELSFESFKKIIEITFKIELDLQNIRTGA